MKWIGQHIYDLVSRFREDVYLEDLSTTTETNVLVVDSDGKVSKSTSVGGDLTEITAGTLIDVTDGTGPNVTVNVDLSEAPAAVMAAGDGIIFTDADDSNAAKQETLQDLLDTIAGTVGTTGLDRSGATLVVSDLHPVGVSGAADQLLTDDGDGTITSESLLTFDGVTLRVLSGAEDSNMMEIDANSLTTGSALVVDVDDALTASATKSLVKIDYDKAGVTAATATSTTTGLDINMADAATNHALGAVVMTGIQVDLDSASADGGISKTGLTLNVGADGVGDANRTTGIEMEVTDGGTDIKMTSSDNTTADFCTIATGASGATTITTTDGGGTAANFEVAADGDITLDAAGSIALECGSGTLTSDAADITVSNASTSKPSLSMYNQADNSSGPNINFVSLRVDSSIQPGEDADVLGQINFSGYNDGTPAFKTFASIDGTIADATTGQEAGKLELKVAEFDSTLTTGLKLDGDTDANGEIDVTIGAGAASVATIAGTLTMGSTAAMTNAGLLSVANQSNITGLGTISSGVWNGTKITDIYTNSSGKRYGSTIKILPSDFMINDDAAVPLSFKDGSNSGVHINDTANEAIAFVTIPEGMKATHVDVYATNNKTLKVWAPDLNASFDFTGTTLGTGACNTQLDITDTNATATNYLAIQVSLTATSNRIWGGIVTIAPQ